MGSLGGPSDESFCLDWNRKRNGLLTSAAGATVCVWDVNQNVTNNPDEGEFLFQIKMAHGSDEVPVNDVKFSPHNDY